MFNSSSLKFAYQQIEDYVALLSPEDRADMIQVSVPDWTADDIAQHLDSQSPFPF